MRIQCGLGDLLKLVAGPKSFPRCFSVCVCVWQHHRMDLRTRSFYSLSIVALTNSIDVSLQRACVQRANIRLVQPLIIAPTSHSFMFWCVDQDRI